MNAKQKTLELMRRSTMPPGHTPATGAERVELERLEKLYEIRLPQAFEEWLMICNGSLLGPGGTYGIGSHLGRLSMEMQMEPEWIPLKWIPIASDGCGNSYVVDCSESELWGTVYFIDSMQLDRVAFAAATDVWHFLQFLLLRDLGETNWPMEREDTLKLDPDLVRIPSALLPWK